MSRAFVKGRSDRARCGCRTGPRPFRPPELRDPPGARSPFPPVEQLREARRNAEAILDEEERRAARPCRSRPALHTSTLDTAELVDPRGLPPDRCISDPR